MITKICCTCKQEKLPENFNKNKSTKDGLHKQCKDCLRIYREVNKEKILNRVKQYYLDNTEDRKEYLKRYQEENKEILKEKSKEYWEKNKEELSVIRSLKYRETKDAHPEKIMFYIAKARAKKQNIPFSITIDDIVIPEICPILKIKLKSSTKSPTSNSPSLDKIIPELGYVKGNIQVISHKANAMKTNASISELLLFSEWVREKLLQLVK